MMYVTITEPGLFLGLTGNRLVISQSKSIIREIPLSKIHSIMIESKGIAFSGALAMQCSLRGIPLFMINYRGEAVTALYGLHHHATAKVRENQFNFLRSKDSIIIARDVVSAKIKNQRSMLLYFSKYQKKKNKVIEYNTLIESSDKLVKYLHTMKMSRDDIDKNFICGIEGIAARTYWEALHKSELFNDTFTGRQGRGALEIVNQMLNYGYAVLSGYIWHTLQNTGLELYSGFLHESRPGKPSLVLDVMEEYRSWVVDRIVAIHSNKFNEMTGKCKTTIINGINNIFQKKFLYKGKHVKLQAILQRQMYRLAGHFSGNKIYKPYLFRW